MTPPASESPEVLEQYKLAVEMADRLSARRATANGFFLTVQTTLIALLAVKNIDRGWVAAGGLVLAATWWLLLRSYRELSAAKWKVIQDVEGRLPLKPFSDEWDVLKRDPVAWWRPHQELMYLDDIARRIADKLGPGALPDEEGTDQLLRIYAVLARAKGTAVTNEDIHDAWVAWMADRHPGHGALKPYADLDAATRSEDDAFAVAVRAVAAELRRSA